MSFTRNYNVIITKTKHPDTQEIEYYRIVFDWEKDDWSILKLGLSKNRIHLNRTLDNKLMYFARNRTELIALIKSFINEPGIAISRNFFKILLF